MEKGNFLYRWFFEALPTGIVMGVMLGGGMMYLLKAAEFPVESTSSIEYSTAGMVFVLVYGFAGYRLLRDVMGLIFAAMLIIPAIMSGASCSVACYYEGTDHIIPFEQVLMYPLLAVMVIVGVMVIQHWIFTNIDRWEENRRAKTVKRKNDAAWSKEFDFRADDAENQLSESEGHHPLEIDPLQFYTSLERHL